MDKAVSLRQLGDAQETVLQLLRGEIDAAKRKKYAQNYLDNSDFLNPVNQRGETDYTGYANAAYIFDRWIKRGDASTPVTLSSAGLSFENTGGSYTAVKQAVGPDRFKPNGKTVTAAVKVSSVSGTVRLSLTGGDEAHLDTEVYARAEATSAGIVTITYTAPADLGYAHFSVAISLADGASATVEWAALYEGAFTAETLPEYQSKGYGAELAECQRYQYIISGFCAVYGSLTGSKGTLNFSIPTPVSMRTIPAITGLTMSNVRTVGGSNVTPTISSASVGSFTPHNVNINAVTTSFSGDAYINNTPFVGYVRAAVLDANL